MVCECLSEKKKKKRKKGFSALFIGRKSKRGGKQCAQSNGTV